MPVSRLSHMNLWELHIGERVSIYNPRASHISRRFYHLSDVSMKNAPFSIQARFNKYRPRWPRRAEKLLISLRRRRESQ